METFNACLSCVGAMAKWLKRQTADAEVWVQVPITAWKSWADLPLTTASPRPGAMVLGIRQPQ